MLSRNDAFSWIGNDEIVEKKNHVVDSCVCIYVVTVRRGLQFVEISGIAYM